MEIIKKYNNRKLYSTSLSKYVSMSYILDLVKTGQKFMVVENDTKVDITQKTVQTSLSQMPISLEVLKMVIKGV